VNQLAQDAFISAEGIDFVKAVQAQPAQRAEARLIQRRAIQKRRAAAGAVKLGAEKLRLPETAGTNRDAGDFVKALTADAAIVGKQEIKQTADCPARRASGAAGRRYRASGTG
jgi:hypothetical protein